MRIYLVTLAGTLNEQAWEELCSGAAAEAVLDCEGTKCSVSARFSCVIDSLTKHYLPDELHGRALEIAVQHGELASPEEMEIARAMFEAMSHRNKLN